MMTNTEPWLAYKVLMKADPAELFGTFPQEEKEVLAADISRLLPQSRLCLLDKSLLDFSFVEAKSLPEVSQPFKNMFIEAADGTYLFSFQGHGSGFYFCKAMLCFEDQGRTVVFMWGSDRTQAPGEGYFSASYSANWEVDKHSITKRTTWGAIDAVFKMINSRQTLVGEAKINQKFQRHGLPPHRVRRLVVFKDKNKKAESTEEVLGYPVDWKHTWEVMGHWRKVPFIGKDRDGSYLVSGRTWVNPCVKGSGDLILKTRLMKKHQGCDVSAGDLNG